MTQRTRYVLVGSGLIVAVGLCTGVVAVYGGGLSARRTARGPAELAYVAPGTTAVAYADVRHIMNSQFRQHLRSTLPTGQEQDKFLAETGIDIEHDIDTVLAGLSPLGFAGGGSVLFVRGRFDQAKIEGLATQHGATAETYKGKRLLLSPVPPVSEVTPQPSSLTAPTHAEHRGGGIAFLEPGLVALGSPDAIRRAIDAAETENSVVSNATLMEAVGNVQNDSDAWIVGSPDVVAKSDQLPEMVRNQMASVEWFAFTAGIDDTVTCRLRAETRDAESGEQIRSAVNGALAVARMMSGKDARIDSLLNSIQTSGTGDAIDVSFTVPADVLARMRSGALPFDVPAPR